MPRFLKETRYQPLVFNSQDYDKTITQPPYNPEDHPDPHHPTPAAKYQLGKKLRYHWRCEVSERTGKFNTYSHMGNRQQ